MGASSKASSSAPRSGRGFFVPRLLGAVEVRPEIAAVGAARTLREMQAKDPKVAPDPKAQPVPEEIDRAIRE